jgi:hypothetical protein
MATWEDVRRLALAMPDATEGQTRGNRTWLVGGKLFVWERPLRGSAPTGDILGARVDDLIEKEAVLASDPDVFFTTPHFDNYPSVLVRLDRIAVEKLAEVVEDAWVARAPKRAAAAYLASRA